VVVTTALVESTPTRLFIGGVWQEGSEDRITVVDPATGGTLAETASAGVSDAERAVEAAADALPQWARTAPRARAEVLRRAFDHVCAHGAELAELIVAENGKPLADAVSEVAYAAEFLRWFSEEAVRLDGSLSRSPEGDFNILVRRQPIGVALLVTPWNLPLAMVTRKVAPALGAGCTAVLKPASATPLCALRFAELLSESGLPAGVLNVIPAQDAAAVVGAVLRAEPVRKLSFTGSTTVGRILLSQAAERVVSCSMELGGNAPLVVFDDADLDLAVSAALTAKMRHNAEACTAANRIYAQEGVADAFTDRFTRAMSDLRVGPGIDPATQVGPLIDDFARTKVEALTEAEISGGATATTGGHRIEGDGYFFAPTVLRGVRPDAPILREEIFGPVAPIVTFEDDAEALELANATEYGLMAYVFSKDLARALRTADALDTGMVAINRGVVSNPAAPFGGVKQSGVGREGGHEGILEFTEPKYIGVDW
jgi:succinate-semialdehyde dehydrogenase/glutarate-semialdehyde dehydrogenase